MKHLHKAEEDKREREKRKGMSEEWGMRTGKRIRERGRIRGD